MKIYYGIMMRRSKKEMRRGELVVIMRIRNEMRVLNGEIMREGRDYSFWEKIGMWMMWVSVGWKIEGGRDSVFVGWVC